jgi:N-acetylglucosamine kinase-like BadF-type ATPase
VTNRSESARGVAIGIDAGGSTTDAILVDADGTELARASAGGANVHSVNRQHAEANLSSVISPLLTGHRVRAICVGAAGAGRQADRDELRDVVKWAAPPRMIVIVTHDGEIALRAATSARPAMVVIAGTGSLAYGERADGTSARAGGYGALIGDPGSGHAIGLAAIAHAARALDGVEPMGPLATEIARELGAKSANDLIERMEQSREELRSTVAAVAALAACVAAADRAGDAAAREILARHERLLGSLAAHVAHEVREADAALTVALSGGAFDAVPTLAAAVTQAVQATGPCEVGRSARSPAAGAAAIALERLRADGVL